MNVIIRMSDRDAEKLWHTGMQSFVWEQPDRFTCGDEPFTSPKFAALLWTDSYLEALFLREYYRETGIAAQILSDEADGFDWCVWVPGLDLNLEKVDK